MKWADINLLGRNFANNILKLLRNFMRYFQNILLLTSSMCFLVFTSGPFITKKLLPEAPSFWENFSLVLLKKSTSFPSSVTGPLFIDLNYYCVVGASSLK